MYKIKQAIGYVFEKRKLIITIPVGYSCGNKEMIEKDLSFMKMGAYASLPCEAINIGEANIAYICQMLREKPVNAIAIINPFRYKLFEPLRIIYKRVKIAF